MAMQKAGQTTQRDVSEAERAHDTVLALTQQLLADLHPGTQRRHPVVLDSALERDLGLDSLSRVELAVRVERAFGISLSEQTLGGMVTLRDLLAALPDAPAIPPAAAQPALPPRWAEPTQAVPVETRRLSGSDGLDSGAQRAAMGGVRVLYGAYAWLVFALLAPPTWLLTALAPHPTAAWRVNRLAARIILSLAGIRLTVRGLEHLPRRPCVVVANHASYLDGIALLAALPPHVGFVAKREFLDQPVARIYLSALGAQFVERFDTRRSVEDARRLVDVAKGGMSLGFFPEGTFRRTAGLGPFRLGAYATAVAAAVPVLPVAIHGSRALLRAEQWLPRHGTITVTLGRPVFAPAMDAFAAAVALRDASRTHILAHCGERDVESG